MSINMHNFNFDSQDDIKYTVNKNEISEDYELIHNIDTQVHELELYQAQ